MLRIKAQKPFILVLPLLLLLLNIPFTSTKQSPIQNQYNLHIQTLQLFYNNTNNNTKITIKLLINNSAQYIQLCYHKTRDVNQINDSNKKYVMGLQQLPILLKERSYVPVDVLDPEYFRCFNVFQKREIMEDVQEIVEFQEQVQEMEDKSDNEQGKQNKQAQAHNNHQKNKKKTKKQMEYLYNQYKLKQWLHKLYKKANIALNMYNATGKNDKKLSLQSSQKFSFHLTINNKNNVLIQNLWKQQQTKQYPQFQINKKLQGSSFHQKVTYTLSTAPIYQSSTNINSNKKDNKNKQSIDINSAQCEIQIIQTLPHTMYVDVDQLRSKGMKIQFYLKNDNIENNSHSYQQHHYNFIDVQKPSYLSSQVQYKLTIPLNLWQNTNVNMYSIKIPVHFRYVTPYFLTQLYPNSNPNTKTSNIPTSSSSSSTGSSSTTKKLYKTIEYIQHDLYPLNYGRIVCYNHEYSKLFPKMFPVVQNYLVTKGSAMLPVGDGEMKNVVNAVTLICEILCAMLLVRQLRK